MAGVGTNFILERILSLAKAVAAREGYTFAPNCENNLRLLITSAVTRIQSEPLNQEHAIRTAENNVEILVLEMVRNATRGDNQLHEDTLEKAKRKLCPLYPFC
ncbi:MAG TPA: hypothetical protein VF532_10170 [Candidatus Angelobacter sp.]